MAESCTGEYGGGLRQGGMDKCEGKETERSEEEKRLRVIQRSMEEGLRLV